MTTPRLLLVPLEHRQRLLVKRRLQIEREEPTPVSGCVRLFGNDDFLPWDPTSPDQFFLGIHEDRPSRPLIGNFWGVINRRDGSARLYDFHIEEMAREGGVSEQALQMLEAWLGEQNCRELRIEIHERAVLTVNLLERIGYRPVSVHLAKPLRRVSRIPPAG